jgi:type II protein arginine methyltransferase
VEIPLVDSPLSVNVDDLPPPPPPLSELMIIDHTDKEDEKNEQDHLPPLTSTWHVWSRFRILCDYHPQLFCAIVLTSDLPNEKDLDVWKGEPVRAVIIPTSVFLTNSHGYPCLTPQHQRFLGQMMQLQTQIIIRGDETDSVGGGDEYIQYIKYVQRRHVVVTDQIEFEEPYYDYLQTPLQPLMDNLESQTYETFEKDPIKYRLYEDAIYGALIDRKGKKDCIVLMVLGAGRGPLVAASLRASSRAGVPLRLFAVEKNPNAVVTLKHMSRALGWDEVVEIISSDMRVWEAPMKADIIVSELLGSFSDNELSPECLDGAQKFLCDDGVSIPMKYTSYIAPVSAQKVWKEVRSWKDLKHFETAYVCKLHNFYQFAESQPLFEFVHPNYTTPIDNSRYDSKVFYAQSSSVLHGLIGYFHSQLYGDVCMSIDPHTFSDGMISWFPLFFPLRDPINVAAGDKIEVFFWRNVNTTKVWYEWCVAVNDVNVTVIHNPNGRSNWIGLTI